MLQRKETVVGEDGCIGMTENGKNAAFMSRTVMLQAERARRVAVTVGGSSGVNRARIIHDPSSKLLRETRESMPGGLVPPFPSI